MPPMPMSIYTSQLASNLIFVLNLYKILIIIISNTVIIDEIWLVLFEIPFRVLVLFTVGTKPCISWLS